MHKHQAKIMKTAGNGIAACKKQKLAVVEPCIWFGNSSVCQHFRVKMKVTHKWRHTNGDTHIQTRRHIHTPLNIWITNVYTTNILCINPHTNTQLYLNLTIGHIHKYTCRPVFIYRELYNTCGHKLSCTETDQFTACWEFRWLSGQCWWDYYEWTSRIIISNATLIFI